MLPELAHPGCGGRAAPRWYVCHGRSAQGEQTCLDCHEKTSWDLSLWKEWLLCTALPSFPIAHLAFWGLQALRGQCQACRELV